CTRPYYSNLGWFAYW
nr:immunoglobulin heavy chain junction region [Mus musculus]MBK4186596.1 immunoglobulin heavy chain junction region [Mus musculus]